ncbi:MAG TPA: HD domain-containing protein [Pyrinomonadaceae bacterium]|jgi:GTP pyrophosphokinase
MLLTSRFEDALVYATRLHAAQVRKGSGVPYVAHLLGVASLALEHGADEDEAVAALLHDAVEDQGGAPRLEEIRARFGERVARIVAGCTDADTIPKPPWRERKEQYIAHLAEADASVRLVSAADKLHNARAILSDYRTQGETLWPRFKGGRDGTLWYYRALVEAFRAFGPTPLTDELARVVDEMERLVNKGQK